MSGDTVAIGASHVPGDWKGVRHPEDLSEWAQAWVSETLLLLLTGWFLSEEQGNLYSGSEL